MPPGIRIDLLPGVCALAALSIHLGLPLSSVVLQDFSDRATHPYPVLLYPQAFVSGVLSGPDCQTVVLGRAAKAA